ncbi:MAG: GNAT family N-acetyltransferase [Bacteroides sp.]|nr:GNAT family N-acetyltransferase [Roseburia sp.]MCM1345861.1 GNAT family N-acetyltransferase [Bacteroides sp.]MCM1420251.1 GNAT family N-acetyltransferase [Bacteroides sp.]
MKGNRIIRNTVVADLDDVMAIYEYARSRMRESGNATQWVDGYPSRDRILADMKADSHYVIEDDGRIVGVFVFVTGDEPNYVSIDGAWLNDEPYGTIHRIASAPGTKGIADIVLGFCKDFGIDIRIDTHSDNAPMLGWIVKHGFTYCGVIRVADGTPRKAFHLSCK